MTTTQSGPKAADFADVRATNLAVVLRCIRDRAPCSRADVATATGLNKATVSSLVADLIDRRLVRETGRTEHRIGRPATMLVLDGGGYAAIGIEIGTDSVAAVALDLAGVELVSWRRAFPRGSGQEKTQLRALATIAAKAVARVVEQGRQVLGLTVGVPGLVDPQGVVRLSTELGWRDLDLRGELRKALRSPTFDIGIDNAANLAALAEQRHGPHAGVANFVHVTADGAIAAGVVADGRLLRGARGFAGELAHLQLDPAGPQCRCGRRGCLQALAGVPAIVARALPDVDPDGDLSPEVELVVAQARRGDAPTLRALAEAGRHLGHGLSFLTNIVNPELVLLGGALAALAPWTAPAAEAELAARTLAPDAGGCRVVASALGPRATATGAAVGTLATLESGYLPVAAR
ncbi:xylose repressor [Virgisporangium aliadipatigenens]|uniref:Xylose repressor n=1 Tax=Virgisporangium aliadipatigenens TaxID=741659 RepID=A0A8J3YFP1_9ACTN|nr:ROK family transcriptional regulator [Virgisporangium aliadipatigenens]GIJ44146.1 xylose repressor [Virgisporangium aliadipatigenens]